MPIANLSREEAQRVIELTLADYSTVRQLFWANTYDGVDKYLRGQILKADLERALQDTIEVGYTTTAEVAWEDGGGSGDLSTEAYDWLTARIAEEQGFARGMVAKQAYLISDPDTDPINQAFARADGYTNTLDAVYANIKVLAAGNQMLTFDGTSGAESCADCSRYVGQRHRASWWFAHGAVPPSRDLECKGYKCQHLLRSDNGLLFTI